MLLIKPLYIFGIDRTVQNVVGTGTYGLYAALLSLSYLLQIINDFGIQYFNNQNIAKSNHLLSKYLPNILFVKLFLSLAYFVAVVLTGYYLLGYSKIQLYLLYFLAFNQILISLIFYLRSNISGLQFYRTDSMLSALDKLLMIILCSLLLFVEPMKSSFRIEWFIYAQTASYFITALVAFLLLFRHIEWQRFYIRKEFIILVLKKSYPYALVVFLMGLYTRVDQVMLERMLPDGEQEVGIYAAAYRILDASNMIGFLFAGLLLPMFARLIGAAKSINGLLQFSFKTLFILTVTVSSLCYFFQVEIMTALYDAADDYWGRILGVLMVSFIPVGSSYIFGTLLSANGSLRGLNIIAFIGAVLNVVLNYFLIQEFKSYGAASATLLTQTMVAVGQIYLTVRIFKLKADLKLIARLLVFGGLVVGSTFLLSHYFPYNWIYGLTLCLLVSLLFAFATRLIDFSGMKSLLIEKEKPNGG